MDIELNDSEIKEGLTDYVTKQGINLKGKVIDINIVAGRSNNGFRASLSINPSNVERAIVEEDEEEETTLDKVETPTEDSTPKLTRNVFNN